MLQYFKDNTSIILVDGFVFNNKVKAKQCADCKCVSEVLATNYGNPNLILYACKNSKCKNRFLRLSFDDIPTQSDFGSKPVEN